MGAARTFDIGEVEQAFRTYWRVGTMEERWDDWANLFTEDAVYDERILGSMHGREEVRQWIVPLMEQYGEIYGVYDWHTVEPSGRVVLRMLNRRDKPSCDGYLDFPGVSILQYAGNGLWSHEEDYWAVGLAKQQFELYESLLKSHDPEHRNKRTRLHWNEGPEWA